MQRHHTSKLFYGIYPFKISLALSCKNGELGSHQGWTIRNCQNHLSANTIEHRMYNTVRYKGKYSNPNAMVIMNSSLFLKNRSDFDACVKLWKDNIEAVTSPYDDSCIDLLKDRTELVVRNRLLYKHYRYAVSFKRAYKEPIDDLHNWINDSFFADNNCDAVKWHPNSWNPRLYIKDEADLVLTKLTWGEKIHQITVVCLLSEINAKTTKP
jgi:hypothetical protein